jgi:hypothetical protein
MPGLVPGIHVFAAVKTWMAGTSPAMTNVVRVAPWPTAHPRPRNYASGNDGRRYFAFRLTHA